MLGEGAHAGHRLVRPLTGLWFDPMLTVRGHPQLREPTATALIEALVGIGGPEGASALAQFARSDSSSGVPDAVAALPSLGEPGVRECLSLLGEPRRSFDAAKALMGAHPETLGIAEEVRRVVEAERPSHHASPAERLLLTIEGRLDPPARPRG
jgi:hypothetical protein